MNGAASASAIDVANAAWRDGLSAIRAMKWLTGISLLIMIATGAVEVLLQKRVGSGIEAKLGLRLGIALIQSFFLTPVVIAVHRYVLLGEIARRYVLKPSDRRFSHFFGFMVLFAAAQIAPNVLLQVGAGLGMAKWLYVSTEIILFVMVIVVVTRSVILFPAIAVDAPEATWRNAMCDTKGHSWRIFLILLLTMVPMFIANFGIMILLLPFVADASESDLSVSALLGAVLVGGAISVVSGAALIAAASQLYLHFASRLGRPASLSVERINHVGLSQNL